MKEIEKIFQKPIDNGQSNLYNDDSSSKGTQKRKGITTMENNESIFTKTEKEYKAMDKLYKAKRDLFDSLTALAEIGAYGTENWVTTWEKYKTVFKKLHGYAPHWAR